MSSIKRVIMQPLLLATLLHTFADSTIIARADDACSNAKACLGHAIKTIPSDHGYNLRLTYEPCVAVAPTCNDEVAKAVKCAAEFGIKVQAKAGGHSYASMSEGGMDGSMIIDMRNFIGVEKQDYDETVYKIGTGLRLGDVAVQLFNQSERLVPHGTCPGVGVGGHFLHGGLGYRSRAHGLAMDSIVAMDVIMADGSILLNVTETNHPDLYWAMRGASETIAMATYLYIKTYEAPKNVVAWTFGLDVMKNATDAAAAFQAINKVSYNDSVVDENIFIGMGFGPDRFNADGVYFGSEEDFNSTFMVALLEALPSPPTTTFVKSYNWLQSVVYGAYGADTDVNNISSIVWPQGTYPLKDNFYANSLTAPEGGFETAALENYFDYLINTVAPANVSWYTVMDFWSGNGSVINQKDSNFAAFKTRSASWSMQNVGSTGSDGNPFTQEDVDYIKGMNDAVLSKMTNSKEYGMYINYIDPELSYDEAKERYYGDSIAARLQKLKAILDPNDVFQNPMSIKAE